MKKLLLVLAVVTNSSFASDIINKSLRVGNAANPNPFSVCVANQAINQLLNSTHHYMQLFNSSPDLGNQPALKASLAFLTEKNDLSKKQIFRVVLTSLDTIKGWQLVQSESGEIAPYSTRISSNGVLLGTGNSIIGTVDLSACSQY